MNEKKFTMNTLNYGAMLLVFLFAGAGTFMNAAVQTMIEAWPELPTSTVRMVVSLPPLVSLPVMLFIGTVVGKKLSYRFCAIVGTFLIAAGGVAPFVFSSSWTLVLVFRCLLGIGAGFLGMRNPLIVKSVEPAKQAAYIGYASTLFSLGGFIANPIVGFLAQYSWKHPFLFNGLAFIPLIVMVLFLKEPPEEKAEEKAGDSTKASLTEGKGKISWKVIYYMVMMIITTMTLYPMLSGLATYMADKQIGNTVLAGTMLSAYSIAGVIANMFLGSFHKVLKQYTIAAMCAVTAIGTAAVLFVPSVPSLFLGVILAGGAFTIIMSTFQVYNGRISHPSVMAFCSTVIIAMLQLGVFLHAYFITACHAVFHRATDVESSYLGCLIAYVVMAVIAVVLHVAPEEDYK